MCYDRLRGGLEPACATACPTKSIQFGPLDELRARAAARVETLHAAGVDRGPAVRRRPRRRRRRHGRLLPPARRPRGLPAAARPGRHHPRPAVDVEVGGAPPRPPWPCGVAAAFLGRRRPSMTRSARRSGRTTGGRSSSGRCGSGTSPPTSSPAGWRPGRRCWPPAAGSRATTAWPAAASLGVVDRGRRERRPPGRRPRTPGAVPQHAAGGQGDLAHERGHVAPVRLRHGGHRGHRQRAHRRRPPGRAGRRGRRRRPRPGDGHLHRRPGGRHRHPRLARRPPRAALRVRRRRGRQLRRPGRAPAARRRRAPPGGWRWAGRSSSWSPPRPSSAAWATSARPTAGAGRGVLQQARARRHRRRAPPSSPRPAAAAGRRWRAPSSCWSAPPPSGSPSSTPASSRPTTPPSPSAPNAAASPPEPRRLRRTKRSDHRQTDGAIGSGLTASGGARSPTRDRRRATGSGIGSSTSAASQIGRRGVTVA